jgi:hypothetical protein
MTEQNGLRGLMRLNLSQKAKLIALRLLLLGIILVVKYTPRSSPAHRAQDCSAHRGVASAKESRRAGRCMPGLIANFVQRGSASELDASCASKGLQSPFSTSTTGTTP